MYMYIHDICRNIKHVKCLTDNGSIWSEITRFDGPHTQWEEISLDLPMIMNEPDAKIRFRFTSDSYITDDGWHIDDIQLRGAGENCIAEPPPITVNGRVTAAGTGLPLAAVVETDTGVQTTTDPVTGLYEMSVISGTYGLTAVPDSSGYISETVAITAVDVQPVQKNFALYPLPPVIHVYFPIMFNDR